uniref:Uncharacterized protein n=1 Tax=Oryza sativa subsp. indica TaxID=39946 RepID=C5NNR8_ORYSI|nr:hypothetical protein [Oryza sativa Indica Group]
MAYHPPPSLTAAPFYLLICGRFGMGSDSNGKKRIDLPCGAWRQIDLVEVVLLLQQASHVTTR